MQGYSIPETTRAYGAVLLNADGEEFTDALAARDVVSQAIFDEVDRARGADHRRPARRSGRHDPDQARGRRITLPYMLRRYRGAAITRSTSPLHLPVLHYQGRNLGP